MIALLRRHVLGACLVASQLQTESLQTSLWGQPLSSNPFLIDFPLKRELAAEDYKVIRSRLQSIDLNPILEPLWRGFGRTPHAPYDKFYGRCTRGLCQYFFDPSSGQAPQRSIIEINGGGKDCIVCSVPFCKQYPALMEEQIEGLRQIGFQGTYIAYKGALPCPTGEEPQLAGVPYAWKMFALREALELGYERVLWLDAALFPLQNPQPLFDELSQTGFVAYTVAPNRYRWGIQTVPVSQARGWSQHIFPETRRVIKNATGVDPTRERHFIAACFGFHKGHPLTVPFIERFYELARDGTPFLSELPEEFVIGAMLGESQFKDWHTELPRQAVEHRFFLDIVAGDPLEAWQKAKRLGCLFFWRQHAHPDIWRAVLRPLGKQKELGTELDRPEEPCRK